MKNVMPDEVLAKSKAGMMILSEAARKMQKSLEDKLNTWRANSQREIWRKARYLFYSRSFFGWSVKLNGRKYWCEPYWRLRLIRLFPGSINYEFNDANSHLLLVKRWSYWRINNNCYHTRVWRIYVPTCICCEIKGVFIWRVDMEQFLLDLCVVLLICFMHYLLEWVSFALDYR